MRIIDKLAAFGLLVVACGGSAVTTTGPGGDGGAAPCSQPAPDLSCPSCDTVTASPECDDGAWVCPPAPPCALPSDGGYYAPPDAASDAPEDASSDADADSGGACGACDYATHYCEVSYGPPPNDGGTNATDSCLALPACDGGASCACVTYGPFCTCADDAGDVTVTCPFHP